MKDTKIAWTDATFNPWWGCQRVSPGCEHCYAETFAKRTGHDVWGPTTERRMLSAKNWREPLKWYADAVKAGERRRVFCASMADVCEDRRDLDAPREWLWELIRRTTVGQTWAPGLSYAGGLDWLLLTKRPENLRRLVPEDVLRACWVGTTAEDQQRADERIPHLLATPAAVRFVSAEPLLSHLTLRREWTSPSGYMGNSVGLDWVICGGESGPRARPFDLAWARSLVAQCKAAAVPVFVKQLGARPTESTPLMRFEAFSEEARRAYPNGAATLHTGWSFKDRAGSDPDEWPEDLRVREWPR